MGRTGSFWAHEAYGVEPDILTTAKPLAGGLPMGAVLVTQEVNDAMKPGDHGSTFAGNPLVCAAANVVLDRLEEPGFLERVMAKGRCSYLLSFPTLKHVISNAVALVNWTLTVFQWLRRRALEVYAERKAWQQQARHRSTRRRSVGGCSA